MILKLLKEKVDTEMVEGLDIDAKLNILGTGEYFDVGERLRACELSTRHWRYWRGKGEIGEEMDGVFKVDGIVGDEGCGTDCNRRCLDEEREDWVV